MRRLLGKIRAVLRWIYIGRHEPLTASRFVLVKSDFFLRSRGWLSIDLCIDRQRGSERSNRIHWDWKVSLELDQKNVLWTFFAYNLLDVLYRHFFCCEKIYKLTPITFSLTIIIIRILKIDIYATFLRTKHVIHR